MVRLTRKNIKVFAGNATNNGVFGSLQAENPVTTTNVEQIQSLPAWSVGWNSATMTSEKLPPLEEFQGIQYVTTYQQAYLMQEGMPEWASTVTYYKGSLAKEVTSNGFRIYYSLTNDNTNNLLSDTSNWKKVMDSDDLYAFDSGVVHIAGSETITGQKTFTGGLIKSITSLTYNGVRIQNTQVTKGTTPSSSVGGQFVFQDKDGLDLEHRLGGIETVYGQDGIVTRVTACEPVASSTTYSWIGVIYPNSGSPYTYAPTPTDTTTTSGTQIATTGWVNSTGNNVVHKTGNETIAGIKTFSGSYEADIHLKTTSIDRSETPSTNVYGIFGFKDKNDQVISTVYTAYYTNGGGFVGFNLFNHAGANEFLALRFDTNGNFYTQAPASDANNSIVTTVSKTKAQDGYFELGNGLIVQWGKVSAPSSFPASVTFPKRFTSTNYKIALTYNYNTGIGSDKAHTSIVSGSETTTGFEFRGGISGANAIYEWIAIGY